MLNPLNLISKFIKSNNQKELDRLGKILKKVNSREDEVINRVINQNHSKIILDMNDNEKVLDEYFIKNLWNYLMDYSKKLQD